ncbi:MAG: cation:proton antiporter [Planctomycetaceae bacterium]|jgi:CPA2 family monovalent cation:H+ antiporter-2|nr:cation:proton antiporter [Planctomycetaceae bacterium]
MNETHILYQLLIDLLTILAAGFIAGIVCRRLKMPMVVGYLLIGAVIGNGVLGLLQTSEDVEAPKTEVQTVAENPLPHNPHGILKEKPKEQTGDPFEEEINRETEEAERKILDGFAHLGANLLLFAIGLHFSPSELGKLWRYFLAGGLIQMLGVIVPLTLFVHLIGGDWKIGVVLGSAVSLSSTVLVFKSLEDMGQANSKLGVRSVAILLFQDVAVVPLMVLINLMASLATGSGEGTSILTNILNLSAESLLFIAFVVILRFLFYKFGVPFLFAQRSVELMVLFTGFLWIAVSAVALQLQLPAAMGALAAGVILSETRLTSQITAITVSLRETFSAIFFVSLGALFDPTILFDTPAETLAVLFGCILLKTAAAGLALRAVGIPVIQALAMGLGLSQLGELSFVLLSQGVSTKMFDYETYQRILFVALTSIILTPFFLNIALKWVVKKEVPHEGHEEEHTEMFPEEALKKAVVIGLGPIGNQIATYLHSIGFDVGLIDMNPVNLHHFAQQGYRTVSGSGRDKEVLKLVDVKHATLLVVTIPDDPATMEIVKTVRKMNENCIIMTRCRFLANTILMQQGGADLITCDETELASSAIRSLRKLLRS